MPEQLQPAGPAVRERIQQSLARQGLMSLLGARLTHIGPGRVHITLPARPEVSQQHGYVHAGATSTIADSAGGYAALAVCQLEVHGVGEDGERKLVTHGQQTLICVDRSAE
jgi:acyl-coenzyme A thioesterase PaaI-like protein